MIIIIRTFIMYVAVILSLRFMGKKQIGQLEPSELTVAIMISELATAPLTSKDIPLLNGIISVFVLASIEIFVSIIILKTVKTRRLITGTPSVIVEKGILKEEILKKTRFTTDDLLEKMRLSGIMNISEIQYAFLETGGQVSFILNKKDSPVTSGDLELKIKEELLAFPVITEGIVLKNNLKLIGRDEKWLKDELYKKKEKNLKEILLLTANNEKIIFMQKKGE